MMKRFLAGLITCASLMCAASSMAQIKGWFEDGLEHLAAQRYDDAIRSFTRSIEINPNMQMAYNNRGIAWRMKGDIPRAIEDYNMALELDPEFVDAYSNRGTARFYLGQWAASLADCSMALSIDPSRIWAQNQMAWILATCPEEEYRNGKKAVDLAQKAMAILDSPVLLDTLAAAYAETGRFQEAVETQQKAIKWQEESPEQDPAALDAYKQRLAYYKAGQSWRITSGSHVPKADSEEFSIQAGAFLSSENARNHAADLRSRGCDARVHILESSSGKLWHLVLVGRYATREEAKQAGGDLTARENISTAVFALPSRL